MPEASPAPVLDIQTLEVFYGAVHVLWGISLSVIRGQVVCIIGPNGAGMRREVFYARATAARDPVPFGIFMISLVHFYVCLEPL